ncbi:hypothetical protein IFM89_001583 [Coptis chinensis]|uniref:J domain-containing protein n=1 Tax=Coptis chinensis TaxID=261450 RepID=A0A835HVQ5_9MAGN|nr:hypothetical protein IFM89_001583 [Coptis chinensis]
MFSTRRSMHRASRPNLISCRASTLETKRVGTNFYEVLSLDSENVSFEEVKKAYRSMARQYHPDVVPASRKEESTKKFVELQRAYETLSNPNSRQKYDYELGLNYLSGFGMTGIRSEANFHRDVWEDQLQGLASRSHFKMGRKQRR